MSTTLNNNTDDDDAVLGPTIGLRGLMATIRRKRRIWLITGLIGLIVGASLHFVIPAKYTAQTDLYLTIPTGANPASVTANDVSLLKTNVVAEKAIADGHLHTTPHALLSKYSGLSVSDNILSIKFSGSTKAEAVAGARAVAKAFLDVQASELGLQTNALVRGLHSQIASLNTEIDALNSQISNLSGESPGTASSNRLTDLVNLRSEDESQLFTLQTQVQQALLNEQSTDHSNSVLDPAAIVPVSTIKAVVVDALSGLVAGLAIGIAAVVFGALLSERPLDRSTVAATLGAPVELSLERYRSPHLLRRRRLSRRFRMPSPALRMIERRLRGHLESAPASALAVVSVGTPEPAALAVAALAFALSSEGHRVIVVDASADRPLTSILGLSPTPESMEIFELSAGEGPPVRVLIAPEDPLAMAQKPPPEDADALLVLSTLDAAFGLEQVTPWATDAVMVMTPRGVTLTRMDVTREMLREAGVSLRSVILLDRDPQDESSGVLISGDLRFTSSAVESAGSSV
jgi:capsular polysaccharide biosynthesis protein